MQDEPLHGFSNGKTQWLHELEQGATEIEQLPVNGKAEFPGSLAANCQVKVDLAGQLLKGILSICNKTICQFGELWAIAMGTQNRRIEK